VAKYVSCQFCVSCWQMRSDLGLLEAQCRLAQVSREAQQALWNMAYFARIFKYLSSNRTLGAQ